MAGKKWHGFSFGFCSATGGGSYVDYSCCRVADTIGAGAATPSEARADGPAPARRARQEGPSAHLDARLCRQALRRPGLRLLLGVLLAALLIAALLLARLLVLRCGLGCRTRLLFKRRGTIWRLVSAGSTSAARGKQAVGALCFHTLCGVSQCTVTPHQEAHLADWRDGRAAAQAAREQWAVR